MSTNVAPTGFPWGVGIDKGSLPWFQVQMQPNNSARNGTFRVRNVCYSRKIHGKNFSRNGFRPQSDWVPGCERHVSEAGDLMYTPVYTRQFEKDLKWCVRRGKNPEKFKLIVKTLLAGEPIRAVIHTLSDALKNGIVVIPAEAGIQQRGKREKQPAVSTLFDDRNSILHTSVSSIYVVRVWGHKNDMVTGVTQRYKVIHWYGWTSSDIGWIPASAGMTNRKVNRVTLLMKHWTS